MTGSVWTLHQKSILALCALSIVLDGFDSQVVGFAAPALLADWNISKADLAPIFGIGLLGMTLGAAAGGYVSDRMGRRFGMIASTMLFGTATCAMAIAGNVWQLGGFRFLAGMGLGAALPIAAALVAEVTPPDRRSLAVSISVICIPIGGIVGGFFAAPLLPVIGWRGLFLIAGILPIIVAMVHVFALPESPSYLQARRSALADMTSPDKGVIQDETQDTRFFPTLLSLGLMGRTFALWGAFSASLLSGYLYFNWLPVLLADAGFALSTTSMGLLIYNVGCVIAGLCVGALAIRMRTRLPLLILAAGGAGSAAVLMFLDLSPTRSEWLMPALALQGFCLGGVQVLLYALAVDLFPARIRATGIGSAASMGRIGAIVSSALGAVVLVWGGFGFFLTVMLAMVFGTMCILIVDRPATGPRPGGVSDRRP